MQYLLVKPILIYSREKKIIVYFEPTFMKEGIEAVAENSKSKSSDIELFGG